MDELLCKNNFVLNLNHLYVKEAVMTGFMKIWYKISKQQTILIGWQ